MAVVDPAYQNGSFWGWVLKPPQIGAFVVILAVVMGVTGYRFNWLI